MNISSMTGDERRDWVLEKRGDAVETKRRLLLCYEYIFGYNPMALAGKVVKLQFSRKEPHFIGGDEENKIDLTDLTDLSFSFVPSFVLMRNSPAFYYSTFTLGVPAIETFVESGEKTVEVAGVSTLPIPFTDNPLAAHWGILVLCEGTLFGFDECELQVL
jgi:hypothetical protein